MSIRLHTLYTTIAGMFIQDEVLATLKLSKINPLDTSIYKSLDNLNLGGRCHALLIKEPLHDSNAEKKIFINCRNFLAELCLQMKKRFHFEEDCVIALLKNLDPKVALSPYRNASIISLAVYTYPGLLKRRSSIL